MTLDEFERMANEDGIVVECQTVQQRTNVLELFIECGFRIGSASMEYLRPGGENDTAYMHPSYNPRNQYVSCFRYFSRALERDDITHGIHYNDIRALIENPPKIDERSDAEFADDFASLMC